MKNLLLLSNSTNFGEGYMQWCAESVADFLKVRSSKVVFVPYAAVGFSYEQYTAKVNKALQPYGITVSNLGEATDPRSLLKEATAIVIGGGNTFHLLKLLQDQDLISTINQSVLGGTPFVGWSAGSNVAGATIRTTNDMPIVEPSSFRALELVDFQINPHFTNETLPNHGGESRMQRLQEFLAANPQDSVVCLPESTYLKVSGDQIRYYGSRKGFVLNAKGVYEIEPGSKISV